MLELALAALAGLLAGSFLNVCIYRWPRDLSVVWPGSRCVECGHSIAARDNVPLLSFLALAGRCRHCQSPVSWRYPAVEALTAACFTWLASQYGLTAAAGKLALFAAMQIGMMFADLETRLLPDQFTIGGIGLGLAGSWLAPFGRPVLAGLFPDGSMRWASLAESAFAACLTSGSLWFTGYLYGKIRHREGLGFGDVKMVAMIGAFLGLMPSFVVLLAGCLAGSALGIAYIVITKKDASTYQLPFGTFLGAAAVLVALWPAKA